MVKAATISAFLAVSKDFAIGAFVWCILAVPGVSNSLVDVIGSWVRLVGEVVAVITGFVMLFKHKNNAKELWSFLIELLKR